MWRQLIDKMYRKILEIFGGKLERCGAELDSNGLKFIKIKMEWSWKPVRRWRRPSGADSEKHLISWRNEMKTFAKRRSNRPQRIF